MHEEVQNFGKCYWMKGWGFRWRGNTGW